MWVWFPVIRSSSSPSQLTRWTDGCMSPIKSNRSFSVFFFLLLSSFLKLNVCRLKLSPQCLNIWCRGHRNQTASRQRIRKICRIHRLTLFFFFISLGRLTLQSLAYTGKYLGCYCIFLLPRRFFWLFFFPQGDILKMKAANSSVMRFIHSSNSINIYKKKRMKQNVQIGGWWWNITVIYTLLHTPNQHSWLTA